MISAPTSYAPTQHGPWYVLPAAPSYLQETGVLASALADDVTLVQLASSDPPVHVSGDELPVTCLALTPNGRTLAVCLQLQQLRIHQLGSDSAPRSVRLAAPVYTLAVDSTSTLLVLGGSDGTVTVYDLVRGTTTHSFSGHGLTVSLVCVYGDGDKWLVASGDVSGQVRVWDLVKRKCIRTVSEHTGTVRGLAFSPLGTLVLAARDGLCVVHHPTSFKATLVFQAGSLIEAAGWYVHNECEYAYTAGEDCRLRLWLLSDSPSVAVASKALYETTEELTVTLVFVNHHQFTLVLSDQLLWVHASLADALENHWSELPCTATYAGNHGTVADIRWCGPDLERMAMATNAPALRIVSPGSPYKVELLDGHTDLLTLVDASVDGLWLVTGSRDREVRLWHWNASLFECVAVFKGHAGDVSAVAISRHATPEYVVSGSNDHTVKKWKIPKLTGSVVVVTTSDYTRRAHDSDINALDVLSDSRWFATGLHDRTAKVFSAADGNTVGVLSGHKRGLWDVRFNAHKPEIATALGDKTVRVWGLNDFRCSATLEGHTNAVQRVHFIGGGLRLLLAGADGLVKLWDNTECVKTLGMHANRVWALAPKQDGELFVLADADGYVTVWNDCSVEEAAANEAAAAELVENEQRLANYVAEGNYHEAFLLALTLNHPRRMYDVVAKCRETGELEGLGETVGALLPELLLRLLTRVRDWNTSARLFQVAQDMVAMVVREWGVKLLDVKGCNAMVDAIIPYTDRHRERLEGLLEESYILDYLVESM